MITESTVLLRKQDLLAAPVGDELAMMSVDLGSYFVLSPVAARIWTLLESSTLVGDLIASLIDEFEVDPAVCRSEVLEVLDTMKDYGLLDTGRDPT